MFFNEPPISDYPCDFQKKKKRKDLRRTEKKIWGDKINIGQAQFEQFLETMIFIVNSNSSFDVPNVFFFFLYVSLILPL